MTPHTICGNFAAMAILMTSGAFGTQTEISPVWIFHLDGGASFGSEAVLVVASSAPLLAVLALQREAGLRTVIEILLIEPHQGKSLPVMLHVAARAVGGAGRGLVGPRVEAGMCIEAALNFHVTVQTFESSRTVAEIVALSAFRDTLERSMRARKRSGRDLSPGRPAYQKGHNQSQ
jgi:hypothetical protein